MRINGRGFRVVSGYAIQCCNSPVHLLHCFSHAVPAIGNKPLVVGKFRQIHFLGRIKLALIPYTLSLTFQINVLDMFRCVTSLRPSGIVFNMAVLVEALK